MGRERRQRFALQWGGLALLLQIRMAMLFVQLFRTDREGAALQYTNVQQLANRGSQLKPLAFKFPFVWIYVVAFFGLLAAIVLYLWIAGLRTAMAAEPDASSDDATARPSS